MDTTTPPPSTPQRTEPEIVLRFRALPSPVPVARMVRHLLKTALPRDLPEAITTTKQETR